MADRKYFEGRYAFDRRVLLRGVAALGMAALATGTAVGAASAASLVDKIKNKEAIRIGFSNDPPWAYAGSNNEPLGGAVVIAQEVLKKMGVTKIEPVVTEWGSLIPGLQANRFDIITDSMFILPERCRNVLFTDPIATIPTAAAVAKGNPEDLHSYEDIRDKGLTMVTGAGYRAVKVAQKVGVPDDKIMQVAGYAEIVQALKAGRAAIGIGDPLGLRGAIGDQGGIELADPFTSPEKPGYAAFAFPLNEQASVDAFNAAMKGYIGSAEMMAAVAKYGYDKLLLPDGSKAADLCKG
ncbi:MAG: ectoine/hydroxyectoine ABC transporter substrate-binding protein EhuB [Mesorhizobium sp.]|uniref:ectoine/hydroxyectoine ABC transporter substrate-binding protein EhuB n=1 Tax=Mesorhizobium sp. TaxID=1871066 RepID=UPI000FE8FCAE|nr:ectoine/hydroxyectoine ABC transporter substrate-binding protein EhuB [Mesorhizobium sp.]RWK47252.1 MAG: ectoine/hydroxyectoine ABC transporter substrate-binding protein EhuB [Mesorhizobium sp.]